MRMMRSTALAVSAMAFLAACSDSATGPSAPVRPLTPSFALGDVPDGLVTNVPAVGRFTICKTEDSNVSGVFTIATQSINGGTGAVAGGTVATGGSITVAPGECRIAVVANNHSGSAVRVTITETSAGFVGPVVEQLIEDDNEDSPPPAVVFPESNVAPGLSYDVNLIHGVRLTYRNIVEIPALACDFSTFGGFVLTPNNVSYGGNAGRIEDPPGFAYGDLNFVNHTNGDHIHVWNVTDYGHPEDGPLSQYPDSRLAFGLGSVNGGPANVEVEWRFVDLGEPAKKVGDAVYLKVGGVVLIPEQVVIGGNIQLHPKCKKAPKAEKH
jgi:hypothetical protein